MKNPAESNQNVPAPRVGTHCSPSTGLPGLDEVLQGIRAGDNVVWRVDSIDHYMVFARAAVRYANDCGARPLYVRFGAHEPVPGADLDMEVFEVSPSLGFENFITRIHEEIRRRGRGEFYIFDSLSELSNSTYSDRMIGNFFTLTCPLLHRLESVAYFALYRYFHSYHAAAPITETTPLLLDVYHHFGTYFVQPVKAEMRSSPTIHMLHRWQNEQFIPVRESHIITEVATATPWPGLPSASYRMIGVWDKTFVVAEAVQQEVEAGTCPPERYDAIFHRVLELIISRDRPMLELAKQYFTLEDVIHIWKRMVGTGMIGGKSVGMLLARAILRRDGPHWSHILEKHDSFFIGSDVFYTYLVQNGCWWIRQQQKDPSRFLKGLDQVRRKIMTGQFPPYIVPRFSDMLDYFGPVPIIVRSSSLLEDNFGNAFAGKYESVFCANQGTKAERMRELTHAVRVIYASTMSAEALAYRKARGVLESDEQMALLVQRVSGRPYGKTFAHYYFPQLAGVGFSLNPYRWHKDIDPDAGLIRIVFGLGTRAVDRTDDDYTRVVALNSPDKQPQSTIADVRRYSQHRVDVLDLEKRELCTMDFGDLIASSDDIPVDLCAERDFEMERYARQQRAATDPFADGIPSAPRLLTFERLFRETDFAHTMKQMMQTLREAYGTHVDVEFTANFTEDGSYRVNLVQCRPLQVQLGGRQLAPLPDVPDEDLLFKAHGAVIGHSRMVEVATVIYVVPELYGVMSEQDRYELARLVGKIVHHPSVQQGAIALAGPGRWGTSTPSLGVPVSFSEISGVAVLCEIDSMHEGLSPDLSLGTHFFNEMVEVNMLYIAYFKGDHRNIFTKSFFDTEPNVLDEIAGESRFKDAVRVIRVPLSGPKPRMYLNADSVNQTAALYRGT